MGSHKKEKGTKNKIHRYNIRISGSGGQGIISTGMLMGKSIAIGDGKNVAQSQSYGPEARGGATFTDIIVSDSEIYFPECDNLNLLVVFTNEAYEKFANKVIPEGLIIADEDAVEILVGTAQTVKVPFIKTAVNKYDKMIIANIISVGFISSYTKIVTPQSIKDSVIDQFEGSRHLELNLKALEEGFKMGKKFLEGNK